MKYIESSSSSVKKAILKVEQLANVDPSQRKDGSLLIFDEDSDRWKISQGLDSVLDGNSNVIRIRRGIDPSNLVIGEVMFDEDTNTLYYCSTTGIRAIAGSGNYITLDTAQVISGDKEFTGNILIDTPIEDRNPATKLYVDTALYGGVSLSTLNDIDILGLTDGSVLIYNSESSKWKVDQTTLNLTDGGNF